MDKGKALKSLCYKIQATKDQIEDANENQAYQSVSYLNGRLETLEGVKNSIENGNWD